MTELDASQSVKRRWLWRGSEPQQMTVSQPDGTEKAYYYHTDHLGTPLALVDQSGVIVWQVALTAYGPMITTNAVTTVDQPWRFPGQYSDWESGLYYNNQRYYDPGTGRYLSLDPARQMDYGYAGGNPINYSDIDGLLKVFIWDRKGIVGPNKAMGHASIRLDDGVTYISWWPSTDRLFYFENHPETKLYWAPANAKQSYKDDRRMEGRDADHVIEIHGLDEKAILRWWKTFKLNNSWTTLEQNCSTTVAEALRQGGAKTGIWWSDWAIVWTPGNVKDYAEDVRQDQLEKQENRTHTRRH